MGGFVEENALDVTIRQQEEEASRELQEILKARLRSGLDRRLARRV